MNQSWPEIFSRPLVKPVHGKMGRIGFPAVVFGVSGDSRPRGDSNCDITKDYGRAFRAHEQDKILRENPHRAGGEVCCAHFEEVQNPCATAPNRGNCGKCVAIYRRVDPDLDSQAFFA
jgi:hypothetical protein